jgi:Family of unknown function (DUF6208)
MTSNRLFSFVRLLWEIPLSVFSWVFFKVMKFLLGRLYTFALSRMTYEAHDWKVFNEDTIGRPLVLPIIATKGPRWNTHAVVVTAGPLEVKHSLSFEVSTSFASASSWSIVIYANPGYQTVTSIESFNITEGAQWHDLPLKPGKYSINLRYYGLRNAPLTPAVKADGEQVVRQKPVPPKNNDFYSELYKRDSWFYAALHYYVFHMLRFRRWLPQALVRREYLPVGDPGTIFRYGLIRKGEWLRFSSADELIDNYDLYLTTYNRSSFPISSAVIRDTTHRTAAATADGFYLLRIRRKATITGEFRENWLQIDSISPVSLGIPVANAEPHQSD